MAGVASAMPSPSSTERPQLDRDSVDYDAKLGEAIVGQRLQFHGKRLRIRAFVAKGDFSYVYHAKHDIESLSSPTGDGERQSKSEPGSSASQEFTDNTVAAANSDGSGHDPIHNSPGSQHSNSQSRTYAIKVTPMLSKYRRRMAEKEAELLLQLKHPSIVKAFGSGFYYLDNDTNDDSDGVKHDVMHTFASNQSNSKRSHQAKAKQDRRKVSAKGKLAHSHGNSDSNDEIDAVTNSAATIPPPQHVLVMEYCEGGSLQEVCNKLAAKGKRFDLQTLVVTFGSICNAVAFLHARSVRVVHRKIQPSNFVLKNGVYKLCDFDSVVLGVLDIRNEDERRKAKGVIERNTTPSYRAPEMINFSITKRLTPATDVWALGCSLYYMAFLKDCFIGGKTSDSGSADDEILKQRIMRGEYHVPEGHPYGASFEELLSRMLDVDPKYRADMTEVILCLSAMFRGQELPERNKVKPTEGNPSKQ